MATGGGKSKAYLGFFTVIQDAEYGLLGGYLVLNQVGRPEEFHCTAPIRPSRAQQILYGATLEPFLFGEQIGQALMAKSKVEPLLVCTDREAALAVRDHVEVPVALVVCGESPAGTATGPSTDSRWRLDTPHSLGGLHTFRLGRNQLAVPGDALDDRDLIVERLADLGESFDLSEPFGRIREAIAEARRGGQ